MNDRGTLARQAVLLAVAFVATLALLLGGAVLIDRLGRSPGAPTRTAPAPTGLVSIAAGTPDGSVK